MKLIELQEKMKGYMLVRSYSEDTIESYLNCVSSFCAYLKRNPKIKAMPHKERIEAYLTWLVTYKDVSPSTQNVHLSALILLHNKLLGMDIQGINAMRARERHRIPPILLREQVLVLINNTPPEYRTAVKVMYGGGLRIKECLQLRVKDIDFGNRKIVIHEGKGDKDRSVDMPESLFEDLKKQVETATKQWQVDRGAKIEGVYLPHALARKYPKASKSLDWYWLFPNKNIGRDPESNLQRRHHVYPYTIEKLFQSIRSEFDLPEYTTPHILRHACFTHLAESMYKQGIPEKMIKSHLRDMAGHITEGTINAYLHLAMPASALIVSPLDVLIQPQKEF